MQITFLKKKNSFRDITLMTVESRHFLTAAIVFFPHIHHLHYILSYFINVFSLLVTLTLLFFEQ